MNNQVNVEKIPWTFSVYISKIKNATLEITAISSMNISQNLLRGKNN